MDIEAINLRAMTEQATQAVIDAAYVSIGIDMDRHAYEGRALPAKYTLWLYCAVGQQTFRSEGKDWNAVMQQFLVWLEEHDLQRTVSDFQPGITLRSLGDPTGAAIDETAVAA